MSAGLFPGHCWLQARRREVDTALWCAPPVGAEALLLSLGKMLDDRADKLRKDAKVALVVSDSIAAITMLPWQETLQSPMELESYARICLEKDGFHIDDAWVLRTAVRHFRAPGIAYALPRGWISGVMEVLQARRLRLTSVLPVTAAAYYGQHVRNGIQQSLLLLREEGRNSALIYGGSRLLGRDVEPATASGQESGIRLLRRISASYGAITRVIDWSTESPEGATPAKFISLCLPAAETRVLRRNVWN